MGFKNFLNQLPQRTLDTTGMLAFTNPLFSSLESWVVRLDAESSRNIRLTATVASYLGIGIAYAAGRDKWLSLWKLKEDDHIVKKWAVETSYNVLANYAILPIFYSINGETDPMKWLVGATSASIFSPIFGTAAGFGMDFIREATGWKPENHEAVYSLSKKVAELPVRTRRTLAATSVVLSVGVMEAVYLATPDSWALQKEESRLESTVHQEELQNSENQFELN